jgi:hypothetical protein
MKNGDSVWEGRQSTVVGEFLALSFTSTLVLGGERWARAQLFCLPVVRLFRHAEDRNGPPPNLIDVGKAAGRLYPEMVANFGQLHTYCPVGHVYSTHNLKAKNEKRGIENPRPYEVAGEKSAIRPTWDRIAEWRVNWHRDGPDTDQRI